MANGFKELKPFRYWCAKVLPLVYDDSLSYYELLGKVIESLNLTMEDVELLNNYFDGIEVQEEIENTLDKMAQDGTLAELMEPYINTKLNPVIASVPTTVTNWLASNIESGDVVLDESFTVGGAAADAFRTGDIFRRMNCFDLLNTITQTDTVHNGVSYQWDGYGRCTVSGTATAQSYSTAIFSETGKLIGYPYPCYPGDVVQYLVESTDSNIYVRVFYYIDSEWVSYHYFNSDFVSVIPSDAAGMLIRIEVASGSEVDGKIKLHAFNTASNQTLEKGLPVLIPSAYDCQEVIERLLTVYGGVQLCKGTYYLGASVDMPADTVIRGMGDATVMQMRGTATTAINGGKNAVIENLHVKGQAGNQIQNTDNGEHGIVFDGANGSNYIYNPRVQNVTVSNVAGAGIMVKRTGGHPLNSVTITNCQIYYAHVGLQMIYGGEYTRVFGCSVTNCYHGVENSAGNNVFVGCDFSKNYNALMIGLENPPEGYQSNSGHGTFSGCTFNHSNDNEGYAIIARGLEHGIVFEGCQFWYGTLYFNVNESPALFNGCEFRGTADTSFSAYQSDIIVNSSMLQNAMTNSVSQGSLVFNNCYLMDMTPIT